MTDLFQLGYSASSHKMILHEVVSVHCKLLAVGTGVHNQLRLTPAFSLATFLYIYR